jgi:carboxymethylenebutenolidase
MKDARATQSTKLDLARSTTDAVTMLGELKKSSRGGKVGIVGFLLGRRFRRPGSGSRPATSSTPAFPITVRPPTRRKPPRSGAAANPPAGLDQRVAQTLFPFVAALREARRRSSSRSMTRPITPSTTTPRPSATTRKPADLAWQRTVRFFHKYLG